MTVTQAFRVWKVTVFRMGSVTLALLLFGAGCTKTLVKDEVRNPAANAPHCSGGEWDDDSTLATLPIPVVAFFVPRFDLNESRAEDYLRRCGEGSRLINRQVEVHKVACIPAGLTYLISLGIWQRCPAHVTWEADLEPAGS
ncbi:MAG: hypothetical protein ACREI3_03685 [Nitrospirales bacterium]